MVLKCIWLQFMVKKIDLTALCPENHPCAPWGLLPSVPGTVRNCVRGSPVLWLLRRLRQWGAPTTHGTGELCWGIFFSCFLPARLQWAGCPFTKGYCSSQGGLYYVTPCWVLEGTPSHVPPAWGVVTALLLLAPGSCTNGCSLLCLCKLSLC